MRIGSVYKTWYVGRLPSPSPSYKASGEFPLVETVDNAISLVDIRLLLTNEVQRSQVICAMSKMIQKLCCKELRSLRWQGFLVLTSRMSRTLFMCPSSINPFQATPPIGATRRSHAKVLKRALRHYGNCVKEKRKVKVGQFAAAEDAK